MPIRNYMSWGGGFDLVAITEGAEVPNIMVHVAEMVHTPAGSAPSGMVLIQRDTKAAPELMGFISTDTEVAKYFGPSIFKGTLFEAKPALEASILIYKRDNSISTRVIVGDFTIESTIGALGSLEHHSRHASEQTPFSQEVLERIGSEVSLSINGEELVVSLPPMGISGGAPAVSSPAGIYSRS